MEGFAVSPPESRTEGGRRQEREGQQLEKREPGGDSSVRGSCRLPRFMDTPWTV